VNGYESRTKSVRLPF